MSGPAAERRRGTRGAGEPPRGLRIGIDIGGTFTDVAVADPDGYVEIYKAPSTPREPLQGLFEALGKAAAARGLTPAGLLGACGLFAHGTTIATNILVEGRGARVGLITTAGFRDTLAIRRGRREQLWDHRRPNPPDLVPRYLRIGIDERVDKHGRIERPVPEAELRAAAETFRRHGVESVAVCLFNAFLNPANELAVGRVLAQLLPGVPVTLSTDILPVIGEYERTSTAVVNAFVAPPTSRYLRRLSAELRAAGLAAPLLVMQNNGGLAEADACAARPAALTVSGPAAGASAAALFGRATGEADLISLDMGGTSCDITLIRGGQPATTNELAISGYHVAISSIDVETVGAGGGTVGWVDSAGLLRMGPHSAGADPGPACYGRGGEDPTVTDAHLVLGRLDPDAFLGGEIRLEPGLAEAAIRRKVAGPLGLGVPEAAAGMLRVVNVKMASAIRRITVQRGDDPRRFCLISAGGAGGLHAGALARELGIRRVYVPRAAAAYCALGMLEAAWRQDYREPLSGPLAELDAGLLAARLDDLRARAARVLGADGRVFGPPVFQAALSLRYDGQQGDLDVPVSLPLGPEELAAVQHRFHRRHAELFGFERPGARIEAVELRLGAWRQARSIVLRRATPARGSLPPPRAVRRAYVEDLGGFAEVRVYAGGDLAPGHRLSGPAIVAEPTTTIVVGGRDRLAVDNFGNYLLEVGEETPAT